MLLLMRFLTFYFLKTKFTKFEEGNTPINCVQLSSGFLHWALLLSSITSLNLVIIVSSMLLTVRCLFP